ELRDPAGNVLASGSNSQSGADILLPKTTLPADGVYKVLVQTGKPGSQGHYVLTVWDATALQYPLPLNQTVNGTIPTPFPEEHWQFSALAASQVKFELVSATSSSIKFDLTGPDGYVGFTGLSGNSALLSLPTSGGYVLRAYAADGKTGSYTCRVIETTQ